MVEGMARGTKSAAAYNSPVFRPAGGASGLSFDRKRVFQICLLLALVAGAFRLPRLGTPAELVYDEEFQVPGALDYLQGRLPRDMVHPPLAKLLTASSLYYLGPTPAAWRLPSALAGMLLAPAVFLLGRVVLRRERAALLAATLMLLDGQALVQSRLATTNSFGVLFQVAAAYLLLSAALAERLPAARFLGAAAFMGMAVSTRWSSLPLMACFALALVCIRRRRLLERREMLLCAAAGALIVAVYVASYGPFLAQGHTLGQLVQLQRAMFEHHAASNAYHPYASRWYTWPWLVRPSLYYSHPPTAAFPWMVMVMAMGNPLVWWLSVPASLGALAAGVWRRDPRPLFGAAAFFSAWLWWALSARGLQFAHYFLEAVPYACLSLGFLLDRVWDGPLRWACRVYVALVALCFLHFYPVQAALPISPALFYRHLFGHVYPWRWLRSWF